MGDKKLEGCTIETQQKGIRERHPGCLSHNLLIQRGGAYYTANTDTLMKNI